MTNDNNVDCSNGHCRGSGTYVDKNIKQNNNINNVGMGEIYERFNRKIKEKFSRFWTR